VALDLIAELEGLVQGCEAAGIEFALCGGLAVAIHGHPRATMDIDLLIRDDKLDEALRVARQLGFDLPARKMTFGLPTGATREVQRVSKLDATTNALMSLDLLIVSPELQSVWDGRITVRWRERDLSIVSRAGLVTMKRIAGRPQDLADIAALEAADDEAT
jgi:hypothetical protein